jgi:nicotinamide-nucleotide amidase
MSTSTPEAGIERLRRRGWTLCTAESLTAGLVAASAANVAGCSDVLRGGVVAYHEAIKATVLELDSTILSQGVVSRAVAEAMAVSVRRLLQADVAISTTGVAGPEPHGGEPVGSVWIAVATPERIEGEHLSLHGDRGDIRRQTVNACWELLERVLG